jgi:enoyl-CoA hydratase/carnithine racemase
MLALCCDYRLMTDGKAWCCMNEVRPFLSRSKSSTFIHISTYSNPLVPSQIDFGAPFPPFFGSVLKHKLPTPTVLREVSLGKRFTAPELLAVGVVDQIIPSSELREKGLKFAEEIGKKSAQGPWGAIKVRLSLIPLYFHHERIGS